MASNRRKLRSSLIVMALAAIVIVSLLAWQKRQQIIAEHQVAATRILAQINQQQSQIISETRRFLKALSKAPPIRQPSSPECTTFLTQALELAPEYINLGVSTANGELLCSGKALDAPVDVADREYIRQALDTGSFSIGRFQTDRATGLTSLNFAYPVYDETSQTQPVGAVVAAVSLDWWRRELENTKLPEGSAAYVLDRDNQVVGAFSQRNGLLGALPSQSILKAARGPGERPVYVKNGDGVRRIYSISPLFVEDNGNRMSMLLGLSVEPGILAANKEMFFQVVAFGGLWALVWLVLTRLLIRRVVHPMTQLLAEFERVELGSSDDDQQGACFDAQAPAEIRQVFENFRKMTKDHVQAQAESRAQTERMTSLVNALPDTYFRIDQDAKVLDWQTSNPSDLIVPKHKILGQNLQNLLPEDVFDRLSKKLEERSRTGRVTEFEYELSIEGATHSFEARLNGVPNSDEVIIVVRNITKRLLVEKERDLAKAQLQRVINNLPGATISLDVTNPKEPTPIFMSSQVKDIWGYTAEEILADFSLLEASYDPDERAKALAKLVIGSETLEPFSHDHKIRMPDGKVKFLRSLTGWITTADGRIQTVGFVQDISAEVDTQRQLEAQRELVHQSQKHESIGQLTGGVAHDFNNLLAVIMGNMELLRDELSDEEQLRFIDTSISATKRGADLTRNMLAFARKARLEPVHIELNELVSETRNWIGRTLPSTISVETSLLFGLWDIEADPSSTESALLNLILNARDAMPEGGKLTLKTENVQIDEACGDSRGATLKAGRYVMLAVSDTGEGMPKDVADRIFDPFFSTKPTGKGSGLGLSMVQGFMEQSNGAVQVFTEPGVGTTIKLYFRATGPASTSEAAQLVGKSVVQTTGQRILVAEDEPEVLAALDKTLRKAGYTVVTAKSGDDAFAIFQGDSNFDVLLTDIVMPGELQGIGLARALRRLKPDLPAVFMSGYAREEAAHGNGIRPEDTRLMKPVARADLLAALAKAIEIVRGA